MRLARFLPPFALAAALLAAAAPAHRRRPGQDLPLRLRDRRDELRPAEDQRRLLEHRERRDLRFAAGVRLPGAAPEAQAQHARRDAGDQLRRPHLHAAGEARHLLRRRPGVQGEEARAGGRGLRLHHEAAHGPEARRAAPRGDRGHHPGQRRGAREGAQGQPLRLRRPHRGPEGAGPLHLPDQAHAALLRVHLQPRGLPRGLRGGARGGRALRRRHRLAPGGHGAVEARPLEALLQDGVRAQSQLPRGVFPRRADARGHGGRGGPRPHEGQATADGGPGRGVRGGGGAAALARLPERGARPRLPRLRGIRQCRLAQRQARPESQEARPPDGAGAGAGPHLRILQHGGLAGGRLCSREGGAAARHLARLQLQRRDRHREEGPGHSRKHALQSRRGGVRPQLPHQRERIQRAQGTRPARHVRLRGPGRRRLPRAARRQPPGARRTPPRPPRATSRSTSCGSAAWTTWASR